MARQTTNIAENEVFAGAKKCRRVVRVLGDRIYYSTGGDGKPKCCRRAAFLAWMRRHNAGVVDRTAEVAL